MLGCYDCYDEVLQLGGSKTLIFDIMSFCKSSCSFSSTTIKQIKKITVALSHVVTTKTTDL